VKLRMTQDAFTTLEVSLKETKLQELTINYVYLEETALESLAQGLKENQSLKMLNLAYCNI
jgi:hypothetical protein